MSNFLRKFILLQVLFIATATFASDPSINLYYGYTNMAFGNVDNNFRVHPSETVITQVGSGFLTDSTYTLSESNDRHTVHRFGFSIGIDMDDYFYITYNDIRIGSNFDYFQFRHDSFFNFHLFQFLGIYVTASGGFSFDWLGNTSSVISTPLSGDIGSTDKLYLIQPGSNSTAGTTPWMFTLGPYIFTGSTGLAFSTTLFELISISYVHMFNLFDYVVSDEDLLNSSSLNGFSIATKTLGDTSLLLPVFQELRFSLNMEKVNAEDYSLFMSLRILRHPSLGLTETSYIFGITLTDIDL